MRRLSVLMMAAGVAVGSAIFTAPAAVAATYEKEGTSGTPAAPGE